MAQTKTSKPKYAVGQRVEVLVTDFVPQPNGGFAVVPDVWSPGVIDRVEMFEDGKMQVFVLRDTGQWSPQIIGKRGGNNHIRSL